MCYNIAIDGPAGAGKSTISKRLARELSFVYVDTGAMYRAMAVYFLRLGLNGSEQDKIKEACKDVHVEIDYKDDEQQVFLNEENVTGLIRTEEVGKLTSTVSAYPFVREKLVELQKKLASNKNTIMDGRDIGTCVLPNADLKIYLTATVDARAKRRFTELREKGMLCTLEEIQKDIEMRDYQDMNRETSPLKQAEDAILVDTSNLSIDQVVHTILKIKESRDQGRSR